MRFWLEKNQRSYNDKELVELFLEPKRELFFLNPSNGWFGKEHIFKSVAEHWLENGHFGEDYDDITIIAAQRKWREFLDLFNQI